MKKILLLASAITISLSTYAQNWKLDPSHSKINFTAKYLVISDVDGEFKKFDGTFTSTKGDFSDLQLSVSADKFPKITFVSKGIKSLGNNKFMLSGTLTVRDVTKNVEIPLVYGGTVTDPWGNVKAGFKASGTINRKDYGLKYANAAATGEAVVGDNVEFTINAILIKQ